MIAEVSTPPNPVMTAAGYKQAISAIDELKKVFSMAAELCNGKNNDIIYCFIIQETMRVYKKNKNRFYVAQDDMCVQARSSCFFLIKKHTTIPLREIARRFKTDHSNISRRITTVETAFEIKVTHESFIERVTLIENNLVKFLENKFQHQ